MPMSRASGSSVSRRSASASPVMWSVMTPSLAPAAEPGQGTHRCGEDGRLGCQERHGGVIRHESRRSEHMPDRRPLSTGRLLAARSRARAGLLASAAATVAAAVATVAVLLGSLSRAVETAGVPAPPGVPADEVAARVAAGTTALVSAAPALILLVAILAGAATAQLGRLLAAAREHEWAIVRARGLSRRQAWVTDAAESAVVALAGAIAGMAVAALLRGIAGLSPLGAAPEALAVVAMAVLLAVVLTVSLRRSAQQRGVGRGARATTGAVVVVV